MALESKPRVFVARPCVVTNNGGFGIVESGVVAEIPMIEEVAKELKLGVIDIHAATEKAAKTNAKLIPDSVHPGNDGAAIMAATVYKALLGKEYDGASTIVAPPPPKPAATQPATKPHH